MWLPQISAYMRIPIILGYLGGFDNVENDRNGLSFGLKMCRYRDIHIAVVGCPRICCEVNFTAVIL